MHTHTSLSSFIMCRVAPTTTRLAPWLWPSSTWPRPPSRSTSSKCWPTAELWLPACSRCVGLNFCAHVHVLREVCWCQRVRVTNVASLSSRHHSRKCMGFSCLQRPTHFLLYLEERLATFVSREGDITLPQGIANAHVFVSRKVCRCWVSVCGSRMWPVPPHGITAASGGQQPSEGQPEFLPLLIMLPLLLRVLQPISGTPAAAMCAFTEPPECV